MRRDAVAAIFRRPELNRNFDGAETPRSEKHGRRISNDRGLDAEIVDRLSRKVPCADLRAKMRADLLAGDRGVGPVGTGADRGEAGIASARKAEQTDAFLIDAGRESSL